MAQAIEPPQYEGETLNYLTHLYGDPLRYAACRAENAEDFAKWQEEARPILLHLLGLESIHASLSGHQIKVERGPGEDMGDYTRHPGFLHTEPNFTLPFWYLCPKGDGPFPLALTPHGHDHIGMDSSTGVHHGEDHRHRIVTEDQDVAVQAVKRGFAAIAPATRGQSTTGIPDINGRHGKRDCRSQFIHALLAGRTATGERVWDMMRLIDWAVSLPEVDPDRILVIGNSGGGVITLYTAAADPRVKIAVPSCSYCAFVGENGLVHHCDCNTVPGILRFGEIWDIAGLIAPRHLLIVNGKKDRLFPLNEVDRAVEGIRKIYKTAGAPDHVDHKYGPEGHRFYKNLMWPFIEKNLTS